MAKSKLTELEAAREMKKLKELNIAFHCYYYAVPTSFESKEAQSAFWLRAHPVKQVLND